MKKTFAALMGLVALASAASAAPIALANDWKKEADTDFPTWFAGTSPNADLCRSMAISNDGSKLYVASRFGGNLVHIISASTGADSGTSLVPPAGGYTGGTHIIARVGVGGDGAIYVCNLALAGGPFNIYRHADDVTAATVAYNEASAAGRMGDDMAVKGSGNSTTLLVGMSSTATLAKFTTADGGLTFTKTVITPTAPVISGTPHIAWDPTAGYWFRNTGGSAGAKYDETSNAGPGANNLPRASSSIYGPIFVGAIGATTYYALGSGNVSAGNTIIQGELYDVADLAAAEPVYASDSIRPAAGTKANGNGAGDVIIKDSKIYWLVTNNVIARDSISTATFATDWNAY